MQQFRLVLAVLMFAGSDAFFLNLFKSKAPAQPPQAYSYQQQPYAAQPAPYEPYKIPVWQAVPSGYMAQPVSSSSGSYQANQGQSYGYSAQDSGYGGASYNAPYSAPAPAYDAPAPVYEGGNGVTGSDYTGSSPMISVPVYFPKDSASGQQASSDAHPVPSTYSNGVSGFYDSSIAGSSSINVVGQAVPVHVPISGSSL